MGQPADDAAARIAVRGAVPLNAPLVGEQAKRARAKAEALAGYRCGGCRRRIDGLGYQLTRFRSTVEDGHPTVVTERFACCSRDDCDYGPKMRAEGCSVAEMVEYKWLDDDPFPAVAKTPPQNGGGATG